LPALLEASEEFESTYFAHTPHDELVQAVHELAKNGKTLYLWTGNMRSTADRALTEIGIHHLFKQIISREDVRQTKPHPEGWQLLEQGIARSEYLFVGDSGNDKGAAEALGIDYFGL
jgi:HAD superfamily hydrolase (TIGR01509 family)